MGGGCGRQSPSCLLKFTWLDPTVREASKMQTEALLLLLLLEACLETHLPLRPSLALCLFL